MYQTNSEIWKCMSTRTVRKNISSLQISENSIEVLPWIHLAKSTLGNPVVTTTFERESSYQQDRLPWNLTLPKSLGHKSNRDCSYSLILVSFTTIWVMELWSKGPSYPRISFIPWPPYPLIRVSLYPLTSLSPISRSHIDIYCSYHPVALSRSVATWILRSKTFTAVIGKWSKASSHEHANGWDTRSWPSVPRQYRGPVDRCELGASISLDHVCWNSKALRNDWLWFFESSWIVPRCSAIHACLSRFGSKSTFALFWCELRFLDKTVVVEDLILKTDTRKHTCLTRSHKTDQSAKTNALTIFWHVMPRCGCRKGSPPDESWWKSRTQIESNGILAHSCALIANHDVCVSV